MGAFLCFHRAYFLFAVSFGALSMLTETHLMATAATFYSLVGAIKLESKNKVRLIFWPPCKQAAQAHAICFVISSLSLHIEFI